MTAYTVTAGDIIADAALMIQAKDEDDPIGGAGTDFFLRRLNNVLAFLSTKGLHMWRREETVLPLVADQSLYLLGDASSDAHWASEEDFYATTTTVAAIAAATTITVAVASTIADGDFIGVELDDGTRQWTTVSGAPAGLVVTLTDALTDDAASGATIYTYTTRPSRPLRVIHARRRDGATGTDIQVDIEAQEMYQSQPTKSTGGTVTMIAYKPTLTSGRLNTWQAGANVRQLLRMTVEKQFVAMATTDLVLDVPSEWYEVITTQLAIAAEPSYGQLDSMRVQMLNARARELLMTAEMFDADVGSVYFAPGRRR